MCSVLKIRLICTRRLFQSPSSLSSLLQNNNQTQKCYSYLHNLRAPNGWARILQSKVTLVADRSCEQLGGLLEKTRANKEIPLLNAVGFGSAKYTLSGSSQGKTIIGHFGYPNYYLDSNPPPFPRALMCCRREGSTVGGDPIKKGNRPITERRSMVFVLPSEPSGPADLHTPETLRAKCRHGQLNR